MNPIFWDGIFDLLLQRFLAVLHQHADGGGGSVKLGHSVLLNDLPEAADVRVDGNAFKLDHRRTFVSAAGTSIQYSLMNILARLLTHEDACGAVCKRAVSDVGVARDPADVGCAPVHVVMVMIKNIFEGQRSVEQISSSGVKNTLPRRQRLVVNIDGETKIRAEGAKCVVTSTKTWEHVSHFGFCSGATCVEDKQRILSIQPLRFTLFRRVCHGLVPPHVSLHVPGSLKASGSRSHTFRAAVVVVVSQNTPRSTISSNLKLL